MDISGYTPEPLPVCAPDAHTVMQLSDGTYSEHCELCGLDLANSDIEEEYLWQLRLDDAEELG